jgi:hypothetical protein
MLETAEFSGQVNWMHPYGNRDFRNRGVLRKALLKEFNYLSEPPWAYPAYGSATSP